MATLSPINIISASLDEATVANLNLQTNTLSDIGKTILGSETLTDAFIKGICTKVAMSNITSKIYKNPFARFKSNDTTKGNFGQIEEIYVNPAPDRLTNTSGSELLKQVNPKGAVAYHALNRKSTLKVSFGEFELRNAFNSDNAFMAFYNNIVNSLYSGDSIAEYSLVKRLLALTWDKNYEVTTSGTLKASSLCNDVKIYNDDTPETIAKAFVNASRSMTFPSTKYAMYNIGKEEDSDKVSTWTDTSDLVFILPNSLQTELDFEILAKAFNLSFVDFSKQTILLDGFSTKKYQASSGTKDCACLGFVMDRNVLKLIDAKYKPMLFTNPENDSKTLFLHHWQYAYLSQFCNIASVTLYDTARP